MSFLNSLLAATQPQSKPRGGVNYDKPIGPPAPKRESYQDQLSRLQNAGKSRTREDEQLDAILKGDFNKAKQIRDNDRAKKRAARGDTKTVAQKKTETPGTWNNSVAQARKRLGIKQGEDLDSLLKSALWVYRYSDADETTSKAEIDDVVRMMQSPEGRNELKARIERFRNPEKPEQQVKAGNLSESELEAKRREFDFQDSMDASGLGKTFRTIEDSQKKIESNPFLAKLAQVTGAVAETATLPGIALNAAGVDVAGITEDVTKSAVSGTLTTPARIPANLMKLVSGGVPIEQRGYALAELVADALDVGGLTGMALKANKAGIKEVVKVLAEEAVKAGNVAEDVVEQAVKAIDDIPKEQIDEIAYSFRQPENVGGDVGAEFRKVPEADIPVSKAVEPKAGGVNLPEVDLQRIKQADDLPPVTDTAADVPKAVPQKAVDKPEGFQYRQRDTNELREKYGLQPNTKQKRGDAESLRLVEERNLVSQARDIATDKSKKVLDVEEQFALAIRAEQIDDELSTLLRKMESGDFEYAGESIERLTSELESITTALHKKGGSEAARTLGARSRILQRLNDNPLAYTTAIKRAPLTADEASKVSKIEKELADARAEIQRLQRDGVNKRLGTVRQPRKIEVAIAKTDEQLAAWRKRMESATIQGGKRGGAALPADLVIEGIYLVSKSAVLKGIKSLDDIVRAVRAEGIEADDKQIAEVVGDVLDDLKTPRKKASGPTRATLRKEIKELLEEKPSDYIETMLREAEDLLKSETPESFEQADELLRQSRSLRARIQSGRSYGDDTLIRGKAGIEDERLVRARGKEILARKKIEALARELKRKHEFESGTIGKKMAMGATQVTNNARQMLTIGDNSVVGRQGIVALVTNPKAWGKAFVRSSRSFVSPEKYATRIKELMFGDEMYDDAIAHGLDLTVGPGALEEDLVTVFANAPIIKNSNEAYEVGANTMRLGMYKSLAKYDGLTSQEKDAIANFVNIATGRTTTSLGTGKAADLINGAAFAPRYALSRLQFLMGQPIWQAAKTSPKAAAIIAAEYAKFYSAAGALFYGLKKGEEQELWTVDTNPNSSNFGKVNIGKTSIDVTGGFRAYATLLTRGVSQLVRAVGGSEALKDFPSTDSNGRKTTDFANQFFWFLRSRLSPFARIIDTTLSNKDGELKSFGRKTDPVDMAVQSATPIGAQQAAQGYVNDLDTMEILRNLGLEFFGIGIDVEDEKNKKKSLTESVIEKAFGESP